MFYNPRLTTCSLTNGFSTGVDLKKIDECIGDTEADGDNLILQAEQEAQVYRRKTLDIFT